MIENENSRWIQRFTNFKKAFNQLEMGVNELTKKNPSELEKEGLIQRFEYTQELAWQTIKDFFEFLGERNILGSRDAFQLAVQRGLISLECGEILMQSIKSRNITSHTYNEETAEEIFESINSNFYSAFKEVKEALEKEENERS